MDEKQLFEILEQFTIENSIRGSKGALSLMLVITREVSRMDPPFKEDKFLAPKKGQVAGLSSRKVQNILEEYGIARVLAKEAGRTSRGSIERMRLILGLYNKLSKGGRLEFDKIERWWVERVREYFASMPFRLKMDPSKSMRFAISELLSAVKARQKEQPGSTIIGAVMQHLSGAKLACVLPKARIAHHGFSVADASTGRSADFLIDSIAIHVTATPTESLMDKCAKNLQSGLRPLIITHDKGMAGAALLAENIGISERIDILDIEQFIATNIYEWSQFQDKNRTVSVGRLIEKYNEIVAECETDPSLRIELGDSASG